MTLLESTLRNQQRNLGVTTEQLAVLSGVRVQKLIPGLSGKVPLHFDDLDRVRRTLLRLQKLVEIFRPVPVSLADTRTVAFLLRKLDDGDLNNILTPYARELAIELDRALSHSEVGTLVG